MTAGARALGPLAICYGSRPQVIKASLLIEVLGEQWSLLTVDTGQHYDYELNALLYEQLGVRPPHVCLEVGSGDHGTQTGAILARGAAVLAARSPRAAIVIGDTNSTLGCALAAAKLRIPVVHVEAGLRAADALMAEEINRRAVDAVSTLLCAPSATAEERLRLEHVGGSVVRTGDIARDVLTRHLPRAPRGGEFAGWPLERDAPFIFATLHRAELVDDVRKLSAVLGALGALPLPVILATHPRTRAMLEQQGLLEAFPRALHILPPFGYLEAIACVRDARAVVTDSGGVQREAYWLGTPCVTVRAETEWVETVRLGANVLVHGERATEELPRAVERSIGGDGKSWDRTAYGDGDAAARIRDAVARLL